MLSVPGLCAHVLLCDSANSQYASAKQDAGWHSRSSATKRRTHGVILDATKPLSVNTKQYRYRVFSSNGHLLKGEEEHHSDTLSEVWNHNKCEPA
jgi:hypothetical protein